MCSFLFQFLITKFIKKNRPHLQGTLVLKKTGTLLITRLKYIYNLKAFSMFTFLQENLKTMTILLIGKKNKKD